MDVREFTLRARPGNEPDVVCAYGTEHADDVRQLLDERVMVTGLLVKTKSSTPRMEVDAIEPVLPGAEEG